MKPSHAANDNLIDRTRQVWRPRIGRDLTDEDARQIAENVMASSPSSPNGRGPRCPRRRTILESPTSPKTGSRAMTAETIAKPSAGGKPPAAGQRGTPSLSIRDAEENKVLVRCHAGCEGSRTPGKRERAARHK